MKTKFYQFRQNNSYGTFNIKEENGIGVFVIVEAENAGMANIRAQQIGLYFDGCDSGTDCPCCGDRWYKCDESDGSKKPQIYGSELSEQSAKDSSYPNSIFIHYIDKPFEHFNGGVTP